MLQWQRSLGYITQIDVGERGLATMPLIPVGSASAHGTGHDQST